MIRLFPLLLLAALAAPVAAAEPAPDDERRAFVVGVSLDGELLLARGLFLLAPAERDTFSLSVSVGCNAHATTVRRAGERLHLVDPATGWMSTLMACDATRMYAERAMATVLGGDELTLTDGALRSSRGVILLDPTPVGSPAPEPVPPAPAEPELPLVLLVPLAAVVGGIVILVRRRPTQSQEE
jgi:hypothetical protein